MKKLRIIAVAAGILSSTMGMSAAGDGKIHLKGQLIGMGTTSVKMQYDGAAAIVGDSRDLTLHTDKNGCFDTTFVLEQPQYYNISRNTLYLSPGDDLTVRITTNNKEATFTGRGATANEYMKYRLFPKGGSYIEGGSNLRADFVQTKALIDSLAAVRRGELAALKGVSSQFKQLEGARITADVLNSYINYITYATWLRGEKKTREQLKEEMETFYKNLTVYANPLYKAVAKDELIDVAVVRSVMGYIVQPENDTFKAWGEGVNLSPRMTEMYQAADKANVLRNRVDRNTLDSIRVFIDRLANKEFAVELQAKIKQAQKLAKGSPAIDITFADVEGKTHRLSEFKGKILYLDFWATWCGPCKQESPYFEKMSKEYAGKDIVFIPISTDTNHKAWLNYLNAHAKELKQYNCVDPKLHSEWAIFYIPRFVLIDKDFNIVDAYAPRPSEAAAKTLIDSLLK